MQTLKQTIDYVMRYGGHCRDCADEDGICPRDGTPCEPAPKRAVIEHTLKALEYGMSHGFIQSPFTRPAAPVEGLDRYNLNASFDGPGDAFCAAVKSKKGVFVRFDQAEAIIAAKDAEIARLRDILDITERNELREAENNAALTARVKGLARFVVQKDNRIKEVRASLSTAQKTAEALEAKLAAAEKALEPFADHANDRAVDDTGWRDKETVKIVVSIGDLRKARTALRERE